MNSWIAQLFADPDLLRMGHCQRLEDANLGMGWLYYGLTRLIRPSKVVVIGSFRGFSPLIFGKAMADNLEPGTVYFVDPSLVDDYWKDADRVQRRFDESGVSNVRHFLMTTQQFVDTDDYRGLDRVQIVFIDGYHSEEQARYDYEAMEHLVPPEGVILLHDSVRVATARLYRDGRQYERQVKYFVDKLKQDPRLQVFDLPYAEGLTLVRKTGDGRVV